MTSGPALGWSVASANCAIRDFMAERAGRPLSPDEQAEYEALLAAWVTAVQRQPANATD
ncbi:MULTISPECIES: hypothetical protein [Streptomyces]|uniref:hypothetical protein n=1 Tax=Streptomyces TaxID=1883 RepID=UPI001559D41E|nr:hypothetical protein [Streptomyces kasugaensis]